jgi:hypothetical protein
MYVRGKSGEIRRSGPRLVTTITPRLPNHGYVMRRRVLGEFDAKRMLRETTLPAFGIAGATNLTAAFPHTTA